MSRILHHIGRNDLKKTRQRQIGEQKERAAQKLKESQEAEAKRKQIEEAARPYKSNWREETQLQESDWTPISGSIANSTSQTFQYSTPNFQTGEPNTVTVSGLGGVETIPSEVNVDFGFGEKGSYRTRIWSVWNAGLCCEVKSKVCGSTEKVYKRTC